jgi:hypothetical protein
MQSPKRLARVFIVCERLHMENTKQIIDSIGKPRIKAAMGVTDSQINKHSAADVMPAAWFDFCEKATGQKLPRHLFSFKGAPP